MGVLGFLPVFELDPFLQYRPFPQEPTNYFLAHWHEMAGSFIVYISIQLISPFFSKRYFGTTYTSLPYKTKVNFDIHVVSMIQCILSVLILLPMWNHPSWQNRTEDSYTSINNYSEYGGFVAAVTIGYFLWDLYVCLAHFLLFGVGFLFHAFASLYVFSCCLVPFCQPWIPAFLLFELSTPFVNINWFASRLPAGTFSDSTIMINGLCLLFSFLTVRIFWGFYAVSLVAVDMWNQLHTVNIIFPATILSLNFFLNGLNLFWFHKMVGIAIKKAKGLKKGPRQASKEIDKIE